MVLQQKEDSKRNSITFKIFGHMVWRFCRFYFAIFCRTPFAWLLCGKVINVVFLRPLGSPKSLVLGKWKIILPEKKGRGACNEEDLPPRVR